MYKRAYYIESLIKLEDYIQRCKYVGFDPYDALNSRRLGEIDNNIIRLLFTQFFVYSPFNFRGFFRTNPGINPKAIGLILSSYCKMREAGFLEEKRFLSVSNELVDILLKNCSKGYSGYCWGFNFDWQDLDNYTKKGIPTIVVTSYVANSFLDLYEITNDKKYLEIAESSCDFILNDLNILEMREGVCFSYTPVDENVVIDANFLGVSLLSRVFSINKQGFLIKKAKQVIDFSLSFQNDDGSWIYSVGLNTGKYRNQIDYHQGFMIDSLCNFIKYTDEIEVRYKQSLLLGVKFYLEKQFDEKGRAMWRLPYCFPIDIHHQSQGIITCCNLYKYYNEEKYLDLAKKIAFWTIRNMQDGTGYFYHQKWPIFKNRIAYFRWGQAWMMLALAMLANTLKD